MLILTICKLLLNKNINSYRQNVRLVFRNTSRNLSHLVSPAPGISSIDAVTEENQHECLAEVMTPLWQVPYDEQMNIKYKWTKGVVQNIAGKFRTLSKGKHSQGRLNPYVEQVVPSPVTSSYRNKDELNVRTGVDGNPKTVGFLVGSPARGSAVCVPGTHIISMKQSHKDVAQAFQQYIRSSDLPACHDFRSGNWRSLVVRSTLAGNTMAIAVCHPQDLPQEHLSKEKEHLRTFFVQEGGSHCTPDSLYFQACRNMRCTQEQAPFELLHGSSHLVEQIGAFQFRISPDAFFQVNTAGAERLYDVVLRVAGASSMTTLLDICCGTGTVSILASQHIRGAVGVEVVPDAIQDAKYNAVTNNISNVEFFLGRVEKKLPHILSELDMATDIVAVLNPSRTGVAPKVISLLCNTSQIQRLVYVSCKPDSPSSVNNFVHLCLTGGFFLRRVVPVDMFPHTTHTELVMEFQR